MAGHVTRGSLRGEHQREVEEAREKFLSMSLEKKRQLYRCKDKFKTLDNVETWPQYFEEHIKDNKHHRKWWARNKSKLKVDIRNDLNPKISLFTGDITSLEIDSIANAANESLLGGGGVDGAIHSASGRRLRSECELLNGCQCGEAKLTCGYKLPARYVLHTVGPRGEKPDKLRSCYTSCLELMKEHGLASVAFPCISTGIFGYPNENAAKEALGTIRSWLENNEEYAKKIDRVIMCLFLKKDVEIYQEQMQMFFPLERSDEDGEDTSENNAQASASDGDLELTGDKAEPEVEVEQKEITEHSSDVSSDSQMTEEKTKSQEAENEPKNEKENK